MWSLHALAARIYARGFEDGERAESERSNAQRRREREARITAEKRVPISGVVL
ncbi:hypothetical protein NY08_519 [Rhodococcus sp. B7740]|uniref:hypothetical protein n=1 Tax=Rhodococcus sp. B7740 TaxID=1564114 RepID=UPI0005D8BE57|nr:hypothetical protein [Rhodococcus sp. B7740]AJW38551.1 hypothetical protein NY08_519 [Rhodococcus sp. B7740]